jgi:adenosylhomocysteine nucleosidase
MWQSYLRNWLWGAAVNSVRQRAQGDAPSKENPGQPGHCQIGVAFALDQEAIRLVDRLSGARTLQAAGFVVRTGGFAGKTLAVVSCGAGQAAARKATEALIVAHRPKLVISAGFAGGLRTQVRRGDIVIVQAVLHNGRRLSLGVKSAPASKRVHLGDLVTVDKLVTSSQAKQKLGEQTGALAVDMETFAVADACRELGVPSLGVRIISDAVGDALPADLGQLIAKPTRTRQVSFALGMLLRRPGRAKDLWQLKENALDHSEQLAKFLQTLIEQLPSTDSAQK